MQFPNIKLVLGLDFGKKEQVLKDWAWLILRVLVALLMLRHGFDKFIHFSDKASHFIDPIGLGSVVSLALVVLSEFFASLTLAVGLLTRWSSFLTLFTMVIAAFVVHGADPFAKKELAILYGVAYIFFLVAGGGRYSLDHYLKNKFKS